MRSRAEHRAALAALGAARANKDAALRESAAASSAASPAASPAASCSSSAAPPRLDVASPQTEWEANALASLRAYVEERRQAAATRRCSGHVAEEEGVGADQIVVMAAREFAALRDRDRQRDEKMQRLQVREKSPVSPKKEAYVTQEEAAD